MTERITAERVREEQRSYAYGTRPWDFYKNLATQMEADEKRLKTQEEWIDKFQNTAANTAVQLMLVKAEVERLKEQVRRACGLANDKNAKELSEAYIREWRDYKGSLKEVERLKAEVKSEMLNSLALARRLDAIRKFVNDDHTGAMRDEAGKGDTNE